MKIEVHTVSRTDELKVSVCLFQPSTLAFFLSLTIICNVAGLLMPDYIVSILLLLTYIFREHRAKWVPRIPFYSSPRSQHQKIKLVSVAKTIRCQIHVPVLTTLFPFPTQFPSFISINLFNQNEPSFFDGGPRTVTAQKQTISPLLVPLSPFQLTQDQSTKRKNFKGSMTFVNSLIILKYLHQPEDQFFRNGFSQVTYLLLPLVSWFYIYGIMLMRAAPGNSDTQEDNHPIT